MRIVRLADFLDSKYNLISKAVNLAYEEELLRKDIEALVMNYQKNPAIMYYAIQDKLIEGRADTPDEKKIKEGYEFTKKVHSLITDLKNQRETASVEEIGKTAQKLCKLITENASFIPSTNWDTKGVAATFPAVNYLIFSHMNSATKSNRNERDGQYQKAGKILEIIHSLSVDILKKVKIITGDKTIEIPEKFRGARKPLSIYDIKDFIRQHGNKYGISSEDDWGLVFENDPGLKNQITTVINALNRNHRPKDGHSVMTQIAPILHAHELKSQKLNEPALESGQDLLQEQTRREMLKQKNDKIFENIKKQDFDSKFIEEEKRKELEKNKVKNWNQKLEEEEQLDNLNRLTQGSYLLKALIKKRYL